MMPKAAFVFLPFLQRRRAPRRLIQVRDSHPSAILGRASSSFVNYSCHHFSVRLAIAVGSKKWCLVVVVQKEAVGSSPAEATTEV